MIRWVHSLVALLASAAFAASPDFAKLPLSFEANRGQADAAVKFVARGRGYGLILTDAGAELRFEKGGALRMKLEGAGPPAAITGVAELPGRTNYFVGNDRARWHTNIPTYAKVRYRQVWPGVDLVFYGNGRQLEFDFIVAPGADPAAIQLSFDGAEKPELNDAGELLLGDRLRLRKPVVYQGEGRPVEGRYRRVGNRIRFQVGDYDRSQPLVIDPVLDYSVFLGSPDIDEAAAIGLDRAGNVYVTGSTWAEDYNITDWHVWTGAFVFKLNPAGTQLMYSTYLGGRDGGPDRETHSAGLNIAVDAAGNAYVTGFTAKPDFPITSRLPGVTGGGWDVFAAKLSPSGSELLYSTLLGGPEYDVPTGIAVDVRGRAYITGTASRGFPIVGGLAPPEFRGFARTFVARLNPAGTELEYSTILGSANSHGIAVDSAGNAYVTGSTASPDFPVVSAIQPEPGNGFVFRTADGGTSWTNASRGLPESPNYLVIDPRVPSRLYAFAPGASRGLFRSTDAGRSWKDISPKTPGGWTVGIDPQNTDIVYAAALLADPTNAAGIYKSVDGGDTWRQISDLSGIFDLAVDPANSSAIYAAAAAGVLKSTDGGDTWKTTGLQEGRVLQLAMGEASSIYCLAQLPSEPGKGIIFRSKDGGDTWSKIPEFTDLNFSLAVDPQDRRILYAGGRGLFKSLDGGDTWERVYRRFIIRQIVLGAGSPSVVYVQSQGEDGLIKSTDGGKTWSTILGINQWPLAADPNEPGVLYTGTYGSGRDMFLSKLNASGSALVYSTYLGGRGVEEANAIAVDSDGAAYITGFQCPWQPADFMCSLQAGHAFAMKINPPGKEVVYSVSLGGSGSDTGNAIAVDAAGNAYIAGSTFSPDFPAVRAAQAETSAGSLIRSRDAGANWSAAGTGLSLHWVNVLAASPTMPSTVYAGGQSGLYRSEDGGTTWKATGLVDNYTSAVAIDPRRSSTIWASTSAALLRSADGGETWQRVDQALPDFFRTGKLAIDPERSSTVYVVGSGGIYRTMDNGETWALIREGNFYDIAVLPAPSPALFAVRSDQTGAEIWKSADRGATWTAKFRYEGTWGVVLAVAPPSSTIYATAGNSILKSGDAGETWKPGSSIEGCQPRVLTIAGGQPAVVYVGGLAVTDGTVGGSCVMSSADGGQSWTRLNESVPGGGVVAMTVIPGSRDTVLAGVFPTSDAFVTKLDRQGTIVYSTYLGGRQTDYANAIAVDGQGGAYVAGFTTSPDFPMARRLQSGTAAAGDAFVARIKE